MPTPEGENLKKPENFLIALIIVSYPILKMVNYLKKSGSY